MFAVGLMGLSGFSLHTPARTPARAALNPLPCSLFLSLSLGLNSSLSLSHTHFTFTDLHRLRVTQVAALHATVAEGTEVAISANHCANSTNNWLIGVKKEVDENTTVKVLLMLVLATYTSTCTAAKSHRVSE